MEFSEQALVLKVGRFREIDAWVRLFSPVRGVYTAFAFGGLKSRRRFLGCLDPLNHVRFKVKQTGYKGYHCLTEARLLDAPTALRQDPGRLGMAVNCLKFFEAVPLGPQGVAEAYTLVRRVLAVLGEGLMPSPLFPFLFRARLASLHGMFPTCDRCARCGAPLEGQEAVCHIEAGRLTCPTCREDTPGVRQHLDTAARELLETALTGDPAQWAACQPEPAIAREFSQTVNLLIRYHMGLAWEQGRFVHA